MGSGGSAVGSGGIARDAEVAGSVDIGDTWQMRMEGVEVMMGRNCKAIGDLRLQQAHLASRVTDMERVFRTLEQWLNGLQRVCDWLWQFPWR